MTRTFIGLISRTKEGLPAKEGNVFRLLGFGNEIETGPTYFRGLPRCLSLLAVILRHSFAGLKNPQDGPVSIFLICSPDLLCGAEQI